MLITTLACATTTASVTDTPQNPLPAGFLVGDNSFTMTYAGMERSYVVHIPPDFDPSQPAAMVLAFHGLGLDAEEMMRISGFNDQADLSGFIVVYPEGSGATSSWNAGHCCNVAARDNVDDVGFIRTLIADLTAVLPVDQTQIHATGFSNGAIFVYRLACDLSDVIASFAPVSATPVLDDLEACAPGRSVPVIHFHGTADEPNPYLGGETQGGFQFVSVDDVIQYWVDFDTCDPQPRTSTSGSIQHDVYDNCGSGSTVELYTINGGMHAWPGGEAVNANMGEPNMEISATALIWDFFQSHPMP